MTSPVHHRSLTPSKGTIFFWMTQILDTQKTSGRCFFRGGYLFFVSLKKTLKNDDFCNKKRTPHVENISPPNFRRPEGWSFWAQGSERLSDFRKLCVDTWRAMNPSWEIKVWLWLRRVRVRVRTPESVGFFRECSFSREAEPLYTPRKTN